VTIDEDVLIPRIDRPDDGQFFPTNNLLSSPYLPPQGFDPEQLWKFNALLTAQQVLLGSEVTCPGDDNLDKKVNQKNQKDICDWQFFATLSKGGSGWYDLNFDGFTDDEDLKIIQQNLGANCLKKSRVSQVTGKPPQP
jgi:hypothetical protein